MSSYPDGLSEGTPGAPWNQPDPEPLECDECHELSEDSNVGDHCGAGYTFCDGIMREQDVCSFCGVVDSRCRCDP